LTGDYIPLEEDLMKKILALVLALSLMATMVIAEPVVLAAEMIQTTDLFVEADLSDPLFADIAAPQLAAVEAEQVEGDGVIGTIVAGVIITHVNPGALVQQAVYQAQSAQYSGFSPARAAANAKSAGMLTTAAIMFIGYIVPW
jgi:hypothetical protein